MKYVRSFRVTASLLALVALVMGSVLLGRSAWSALTPPQISTSTMDVEGFGSVEVVRSDRPAQGLVILVTDESDADARRQDAQALADNDAYRFLRASGDLLVSGPTRTNLLDLYVAVRAA